MGPRCDRRRFSVYLRYKKEEMTKSKPKIINAFISVFSLGGWLGAMLESDLNRRGFHWIAMVFISLYFISVIVSFFIPEPKKPEPFEFEKDEQ